MFKYFETVLWSGLKYSLLKAQLKPLLLLRLKRKEKNLPFLTALSIFRGYGFVQFERVEEAEAAKAGQNGRFYKGYKLGKT